ncbi:cysteine proteinase [Ascobolus immersus RN42]|uniref:Cysteine proteinase n=1 Tax=Ascobolus immersus RN42 TaxID=1160509 RepID=A0A3N4HZA3_ASCIM|nr:cysteine proteinase [Ascobolus immersus RN42]
MGTKAYSREQLKVYFKHISLPSAVAESLLSDDEGRLNLGNLEALLIHHLRKVPFENLSLHYAQRKHLGLTEDALWEKMITNGRGRGGYCMEVNTFFGAVLRGCGFEAYMVAGKIAHAMHGGTEGFRGMSHVVNILTLDGQRYLLDVGFGNQNLLRPIPLIPDNVIRTETGFEMKVQHEPIPNSLTGQKFWIYNFRDFDAEAWTQGYCFGETEIFLEDVEQLNYPVLTSPEGFFVNNVTCVRVGEDDERIIIFNDRMTRKKGKDSEVLANFSDEAERVRALKEWFWVSLTDEEKDGIRGMNTELPLKKEEAK